MIDQVCSLALTYAHSDGRPVFSRKDILEAMTTVEAGVAIGQTYPKHESRSIAIHEAGHAVCGHLYMESGMSTRLSIRRRGHSGGHHQIAEIEDRFVALALGGGRRPDLDPRRLRRRAHLLRPEHDRRRRRPALGDAPRRAHGRRSPAWRRRRSISRTGSRTARSAKRKRSACWSASSRSATSSCTAPAADDSAYDSSLKDPAKRKQVAGLLGQAFVIAWNTIRANKEATETVADRLVEAQELYGDDVVALLNEVRLRKPDIDVLDDSQWPVI